MNMIESTRKYGPVNKYTVGGIEMERNHLVIAAIRCDGIVFTGLRHGHIIRDMVVSGFLEKIEDGPAKTRDQGFVDTRGNYVPRAEATQIAIEAGQVPAGHGTLYSEDLW